MEPRLKTNRSVEFAYSPILHSTQNWNRTGITPADAARFDEVSGRLQGELDAIVTCIREDDPGCVNGERDGFRAAFRPAPSSPGCSGGSHRRDLKRNARDYLFAGADGLAEKALISPITAVKRVNAVAAIEAVVTRRAP